MKIEESRDVSVPIAQAWELFTDVPRVARCLPGAEITEIVDDQTYRGKVGLRIGPISVNYRGEITVDELDSETKTMQLTGKGRDSKGAGTAKAKISAQLEEIDADNTRILVSSDVQLTGRVASLGRGVQDVAGKVFEDFVQKMQAELTDPGSVSGTEGSAEGIKVLPMVGSMIKDRFRRDKNGD